MKYKNINEEWETYKETIREPLSDKRKTERIWREAYMRGFEVAKEDFNVNRVEIINHNTQSKEIGRLFVHRGNIDVQLQDDDRTLKVFI
jgi:hypothetical protein